MFKPYKLRRMERQRKQRLITKVQKAKSLDKMPEILAIPTWNGRFGRVSALRAG